MTKSFVIEKKEIIAESQRRSYELVRLTRQKYKDNQYSFIDIRLFQRGYDDEGNEVYHPTKKGVQFREDLFQELIGKWTLVPSLLFHRLIYEKVWPLIEIRKFSSAVFEAFKIVEISVRNLCNLPADVIGTNLMRKAFDCQKGILTNMSLPIAEREALSHLFAGAIGLYKNSHSHREVEISFNQAFEMLLLASHLLNVLDSIEKKANA